MLALGWHLVLVTLLALALSPSRSAALECLYSRGFKDVSYKITRQCEAAHLICYEALVNSTDDSFEMEYKAQCGKGDECHGQDASTCHACQGDRCNSELIARVLASSLKCFAYVGDVTQAEYVNTNSHTSGAMHLPNVLEKQVHCATGVSQCHRVKYTQIEAAAATTVFDRSYIYIRGGCGKVSCNQWGPAINCLNCGRSLCNSVANVPTVVSRNVNSDEAVSTTGTSPSVTGVPGSPVTGTVTAVTVAVVALVLRGDFD